MRGDGRIYLRGEVWWVEYWHNGHQVRESSKGFVSTQNAKPSDGRDRRAAEKLLKERRRTAGTPHFIGPKAERVTFEDLATMYLTDYRVNRRRSVDHATRYVRNLRAVFGFDRALDITADRIEAYKGRRLEEGLQPGAVNRELAALRRMFSLAVRAGKLPHRPHIALLDESGNVREGFLEPAEFEAVCAQLPPYLQDPARFAYTTCWRIGAVRALEWRDVDLRGRTLQLRAASAKNKRAKLIPLAGELLALFECRAAVRDLACPYVFTGRDGDRLGDFRKAWRRAAAAAGIRGLLFHDLRRSAARNAIRSGVPEQVVMDLGGWRTRSVLARYNVTSERDLADALERVSQYVSRRAEEAPRVTPLRPEPAQNPHNRPSRARDAGEGAVVTPGNPDWRRPESNRGPRDYETLALAN
jgi:integrase